MNIDLSTEEYRTLLDILSIAHFVLDPGETGPLPEAQPALDLEQKLLSYASVFGAEDLVEFFPDKGMASPTEKFDQTSDFPFLLHEYNDFVFWEELVARLAEQDLRRDFGEDTLEDMSFEERIRREQEYEKPYWNEFEKHGIERVNVIPID